MGKIDLATNPGYELNLAIAPFSPRKITAALGQKFSLKTTKPNLLERLALKAHVIGDTKSIAISEGNLNFDQSKLNFSLDAKNFNKPDVAFDLSLDQIDLDAYLPPSSESNAQTEKKPEAAGPKKETLDYAPLRKLAIDGKIQAFALKVGGTQVQDLNLSVSGKGGFFRLDPLTVKVYQGNLSAKGSLDVREDQAKSNLTLETKGVQIGPLLRGQLKKDVLEGALQSKVTIAMTGDDADQIKRSLNGDGALIYQ